MKSASPGSTTKLPHHLCLIHGTRMVPLGGLSLSKVLRRRDSASALDDKAFLCGQTICSFYRSHRDLPAASTIAARITRIYHSTSFSFHIKIALDFVAESNIIPTPHISLRGHLHDFRVHPAVQYLVTARVCLTKSLKSRLSVQWVVGPNFRRCRGILLEEP